MRELALEHPLVSALALIAAVGALCWLVSPWLYFVAAVAWVAYEVGCGSDEEQFNRGLRRELAKQEQREAFARWVDEAAARLERDGV